MMNIKEYLDNPYYYKLIGSHREWLNLFDSKFLNAWDKLFKKNNPEAALFEAATRQVLGEFDIVVEPFDDPSRDKNPDYYCKKNNQVFYVEATCITKEVATDNTNLDDIPKNLEVTGYALLTKTFFNDVVNKTTQCSNLNAPVLLAIGTWHFSACQLCFDKGAAEDILTSTPHITVPISKVTGGPIGDTYEATDLRWSAFVRPSKTTSGEIEFARSPISGILLCPFGTKPPDIVGVLHPNPNHPFDRNLFPKIPFGRLTDGYQDGKFGVEWI